MVGPCSSCGPFTQYCGHQSNSFSSMFWSQYHNSSYDDDGADHHIYSSSSSSSSSSSYSPSVDCTLSLGTPSTRLSTTENINYDQQQPPKHTPHRNSVSSFCWDLLHPSSTKQQHQPSSKPPRSSTNSASDSLLARRCANCDTTSTPLWRNGPRGPKSLCNACGIRFKKEERRAAAATTTAAPHNGGPAAGLMDPNNGYYNGSWGTHPYGSTNSQKMQSFGAPNEFRFIEDDQRGSEAGIQFLSWLTHDRSSGLVHDFTR